MLRVLHIKHSSPINTCEATSYSYINSVTISGKSTEAKKSGIHSLSHRWHFFCMCIVFVVNYEAQLNIHTALLIVVSTTNRAKPVYIIKLNERNTRNI